MKGKFKLLFTVLSLIGLGLTSCSVHGGENNGGGNEQPQPEDQTPAHVHTYSGYEHDAHDHWQVCTSCQEATAKEAHTGGTATCEHKAVCSVCGAEYGELAPHQYGALIVRVDPTCTTDGVAAHYQCSVCHKYFTEQKVETTLAALAIPKTGHHGQLHAAVAATCTEAGNSAYYECTGCHKYYSDAGCEHEIQANSWVINALGHQPQAHAAHAATCTEAGNSAYYQCERCHKYFSDEACAHEIQENSWVIAALGHHGTLHEAHAATCTEAGNSAYYECSECNKYFSDADCEHEIQANSWVIAATGHHGELHAAQAATCTEAGNIAYYECSNCHKFFSEEECLHELQASEVVVAALGHNGSIHHAAVEAQCESAGNSEYYECDQCHHYFSDANCEHEIEANSWVINAKGHTAVEHAAVEATCTTAGNSKYYSCEDCAKYFSDEECTQEVVANSWVIPATGHEMAKTAAKAASCTAAGNSEYYQCNHCHKFFSDELGNNEITENSWVIPATAHTFDVDYPEIKTLGTYRHAYHHCSECDKLYMLDENSQYVEIANDDAAWENALCQYNDTEFVSSESNPYIIKYDADIIFLRNHTNAEANDTFEGKFLKMVNDIDLGNDADHPFGNPIGPGDAKPFKGTFDGDGHTINNFYIKPIVVDETTTRADALALFSRVTGGTVKNLKMANVHAEATGQRVAAFVARAENATLENLEVVSGTITSLKQGAGIVGVTLGTTTITNCINRASINTTSTANGGIEGLVYSGTTTISGCINYGAITATGAGGDGLGHGGILGTLNSGQADILDCVNNGAITSAGQGTGGLVGFGSAGVLNIRGCENNGAVNASAGYTGGILAYARTVDTNVKQCYNNGNVTSTSEATGGIVGYYGFTDSTKTLTVFECINYGKITGKSNGTGGILGASATPTTFTLLINYCNNYGEINGASYVGGIAGLPRKNSADCLISNCVNAGNVTATTTHCGGITGAARVNVLNCVSLGAAILAVKSSTPAAADTLNALGASTTAPGYLSGSAETNGSGVKSTVTGSLAVPYEITVIIPSGWSMTNIEEGNAQIYVYYWGGALGAQWVLATIVGENTVEAIVPSDATGMKVVRINPEASAPSWDEGVCWNQSNADITIAPATFTYSTTLQ